MSTYTSYVFCEERRKYQCFSFEKKNALFRATCNGQLDFIRSGEKRYIV